MPKQGEEAEKKVKEFLEKKFGKLFSKQKIAIGKGKKKEFDLVSNDYKIVAEVKDYKFDNETTGKSGYSSTRKHRLISACSYLAKVHAEKKMLALTNQEIYEQFKKDMEMEQLHPEIEIIYVPMSHNSDNNFIRPKSADKKEDIKMEKSSKVRTKYLFNGKEFEHGEKGRGKRRLVLEVVKKYLDDNSDISYEELLNIFPKKLQGRVVVLKVSEIRDKEKKRYFMKPEELLRTGDGVEIAVCGEWGNLDEKYNTDRQDIDNFIDHVKETLKYEIEKI